MGFDDKYKLGPMVHRGRAMVFEAREAASGRTVYVHMAAPGPAGPDPLREVRAFLASRVGPGSEIIEVGERSGSTFVVTPATPAFKDLDRWIEAAQGKGSAAVSGGPGEFTQMFQAGSGGPSEPPARFPGGAPPGDFPFSESPTKTETGGWGARPAAQPSGPALSPGPQATRPENKPIPTAPAAETKAGPGEFTKFFHESSAAATTPERPESTSPGPGPGSVSGFHRPAASGLFGSEPASPVAAAPKSGPSAEPSDIFDADTMAVPKGPQQSLPQQPPPRPPTQPLQPPPQPQPRPAAPAPLKSTAGEFTQMFSDASGAAPNVAGQSPGSGGGFRAGSMEDAQTKVTRFRKVGASGSLESSSGSSAPGGQSAFPAGPPPGGPSQKHGEFTNLFGTPKAAPTPSEEDVFTEAPPLPGDEGPREKGGEFTEMFRSPGPDRQRGAEPSRSQPKHRLDHDPLHSGPDALDLPHVEPTEEERAGQFTELFGRRGSANEDWAGGEQARAEPRGYQGPAHPSHAAGGSTDLFQQRAAAPSGAPPPVSSGPSDYTRILKGRPAADPSGQPAAPSAPSGQVSAPPLPTAPPLPAVPQVAPEGLSSASTDNTKLYLILALAFCLLLLIALGIALFFASSTPETQVPAVGGVGFPAGSVDPGSVTAPSVSGTSIIPGSVTAPSVSGSSVYPGSVSAPSVSAPSLSPGSVTAPSVSGTSLDPGSVTAPSVSGTSVYPGSVTAPSVGGTAITPEVPQVGVPTDGGGMPYLAIIVALGLLLIVSAAVAVYFALKKA